jgi:hypothetical protein
MSDADIGPGRDPNGGIGSTLPGVLVSTAEAMPPVNAGMHNRTFDHVARIITSGKKDRTRPDI